RNEHIQALSLEELASIALDEGRARDAVPMLEEAYRIYVDLGDLYRVAISVSRFARVLVSVGKTGIAARLLSCSEALSEEIGASPHWVARMNEPTLNGIRAQLDEAAFAKAWEQGRALTADEAVALARNSLD